MLIFNNIRKIYIKNLNKIENIFVKSENLYNSKNEIFKKRKILTQREINNQICFIKF